VGGNVSSLPPRLFGPLSVLNLFQFQFFLFLQKEGLQADDHPPQLRDRGFFPFGLSPYIVAVAAMPPEPSATVLYRRLLYYIFVFPIPRLWRKTDIDGQKPFALEMENLPKKNRSYTRPSYLARRVVSFIHASFDEVRLQELHPAKRYITLGRQ
jgi:hypothetical protein